MEKLVLNIKGNSYEISCPNVSQFQTIESMKQVLSKGMYAGLMSTTTLSAYEVLDMVDMESYFSVLCPKLLNDLQCKSFGELGLMDYMEFKKIYQDDFMPWWNSILKILRPDAKE